MTVFQGCFISRILNLSITVLILSFTGNSSAADHPDETASGFIWPTNASRILTSTFGEYRPGRFHAGIDIRTNGTTGYPCYAIADGSVIRMRADFGGYGRALYLKLEDGTFAVYAHLSRFNEELEAVFRTLQEKQGRYEVEAFFPPGEHGYKKGDLIAYTGDTGAGPPHLHFELRNTMAEPYNPAMRGYKVEDDKPPVFRGISLKPLDAESEVNADIFPVVHSRLKETVPVDSFYGRVGIAAKIVDFQNSTWFKLGTNRIELWVDDSLKYAFQPDSFNYRYNIQSRLDYDFELERSGYLRYRRLYLLPPNRLPFYDRSLGDGVLDSHLLGPGEHVITINAQDYAGNWSQLDWKVFALEEPKMPSAEPKPGPFPQDVMLSQDSQVQLEISILDEQLRVFVSHIPVDAKSIKLVLPPFGGQVLLKNHEERSWYGRMKLPINYSGKNTLKILMETDSGSVLLAEQSMQLLTVQAGDTASIRSEDGRFSVYLPGRCLWFDLAAALKTEPEISGSATPIYHLVPEETPFAEPFEIRFTADSSSWSDQAVIVYYEKSKGGEWTALETERLENSRILLSEALSFEEFTVMMDTLPPTVENISPGDQSTLAGSRIVLEATIDDDLSGLDLDHSGIMLDGKSVIWIYDIDKDRIYFPVDRSLSKGMHSWHLTAADKVGNRVELDRSFLVQ